MSASTPLERREGICIFRPRGRHTIVEAVDLISRAIEYCRQQRASKLLVDVTGLTDIPVPTLIDRFLMVEDWAKASKGMVAVSMVVPAKYIHPEKFGVQVAAHLGLICDVHSSEEAAWSWLQDNAKHAVRHDK